MCLNLDRTREDILQGHVVTIERYRGRLSWVEIALVGVHALLGLDALALAGGYQGLFDLVQYCVHHFFIVVHGAGHLDGALALGGCARTFEATVKRC